LVYISVNPNLKYALRCLEQREIPATFLNNETDVSPKFCRGLSPAQFGVVLSFEIKGAIMKKCTLAVGGLFAVALQGLAGGQIETVSGTSSDATIIQIKVPTATVESEKKWVRNGIDTRASSELPYDAFLTESGYTVYPVEENCAALHSQVDKNPMVLRKEYVPRRVRVVRRVDCRSADDSVKGVLGKQFMIVSEIGSVTFFMVDLKDLHFAQDKDEALDNPK
jgi:hypothetical protein